MLISWAMMKSGIVSTIVIVDLIMLVQARPPLSVRVGSIFSAQPEESIVHEAFRMSVQKINKDQDVLNATRYKTRLDLDIQYCREDPFEAFDKTCREMSLGVWSVFLSAPVSVDTSVTSVCSGLNVPVLTTSSRPDVSSEFVVRLGPKVEHLVHATADLVKFFNWSEVAYVAHRKTSSLDPQLLIERLQLDGVMVHFLELAKGNVRPDLVQLRNRGVNNFIVDLSANLINAFFDQALGSGIVHSKSTFTIPDLDFLSVSLDLVAFTGAQVYGFSLVDKAAIENDVIGRDIPNDLGGLLLKNHRSALLYDGLHVFYKAIEKLSNGTNDLKGPQVKCGDREAPYDLGKDIMAAMAETSFSKSVTSRRFGSSSNPLRFVPSFLGDNSLERSSIYLDVYKMDKNSGFKTNVGRWSFEAVPETRRWLQMNPDLADAGQTKNTLQQNLTVNRINRDEPIVVQVWETTNSPFFRLNPDGVEFEGFLVDLLDSMSRTMGFAYKMRMSDSKGRLNTTTGQWDGLMAELIHRRADLGLADLTVTSQRQRVIDFSDPFDVSTLTVITKASTSSSSLSLSFISPFSLTTWLSLLVAFIVLSVALFVVSRISPYERRSNQDQTCFGAGISLCNAFWFAFTGFFFRGTHVSPKSFSARFVSAIWWIFCAIVVITYVCNFIHAYRNPDKLDETKKTLEDLLDDDDFVFGAVTGMATYNMIKDSSDPIHQKIWSKLDHTIYIGTMSQGIAELESRKDKFGFLAESSQANLVLSRRCDFITVGNLATKYYGLAFPKGSNLVDAFSKQLTIFGEDGTLSTLRNKWLVPKRNCEKSNVDTDPGFPYLTLLIMTLLGVALSVSELFCYAAVQSVRQSRRRSRQAPSSSFSSILCEEIRNAVHCSKPVRAHYGGQPVNGSVIIKNGANHSADASPTHTTAFLFRETSAAGKKNGANGGPQAQALLRGRMDEDDIANAQL